MDSVRVVNTQVSVDDRNYVSNRKLVKIIDFLGRDSKIFSKKPLIFIYDNGEVEKKIIQ
jgi:hypothetical protein